MSHWKQSEREHYRGGPTKRQLKLWAEQRAAKDALLTPEQREARDRQAAESEARFQAERLQADAERAERDRQVLARVETWKRQQTGAAA